MKGRTPTPLVGVQEPRVWSAPAYVSSAGQEAIELAALAGLHLDPWQRFVLERALGEDAKGRWVAPTVGLVVPRQNGKGSILEARELAAPWEACGWTRASQGARFAKVIGALEPSAGETLLDFGCGTGDLADELSPRVRYLGFDWSLGMFARAVDAHPDRRFTTTLRDGDTWDLVVCCGPFNLADNWSKAQTWALMRMLWARTGRAMAVSLYYGSDPRCIRYPASEVAATAAVLAADWSIERWRSNDLLVVLRR